MAADMHSMDPGPWQERMKMSYLLGEPILGRSKLNMTRSLLNLRARIRLQNTSMYVHNVINHKNLPYSLFSETNKVYLNYKNEQ